jgi:hypothetical protein
MTEHHDEFDRSLGERLRAYEARVPAAPAPNLPILASAPSRGPRSGWLVGGLVGAGGVAAGLILVAILANRPSPPTGQESPTPGPTLNSSPPVTTTPTPSTPEQLSATGISGLGGDDEMRALIEVDGQLVGVGRHGLQGAVWTSADGRSWTLAPSLPESPAELTTTMTSVASGPEGLVAVGSSTAIDFSTPRIWHSLDGQHWTSVYGLGAPDPAVVAFFGKVDAVTNGGPGYVALGISSDDGLTGRPQVWTSADGRSWTAANAEGLSGSVSDVVGGAGMLVAVGGADGAAAYVSTDGTSWTAAPPQQSLQGAEMRSIAFAHGAFVATGALIGPGDTFPSTPAVWLSRDGLHWSLVLQAGALQRISQVVPADAGFVAIGGLFPSAAWSYDPGDPNPPSDTVQLWFSADGATWSGPTTGFLADGGVTLGEATVLGGNLVVPVTLLNGGPDGPIYQPAILRGPLPEQ